MRPAGLRPPILLPPVLAPPSDLPNVDDSVLQRVIRSVSSEESNEFVEAAPPSDSASSSHLLESQPAPLPEDTAPSTCLFQELLPEVQEAICVAAGPLGATLLAVSCRSLLHALRRHRRQTSALLPDAGRHATRELFTLLLDEFTPPSFVLDDERSRTYQFTATLRAASASGNLAPLEVLFERFGWFTDAAPLEDLIANGYFDQAAHLAERFRPSLFPPALKVGIQRCGNLVLYKKACDRYPIIDVPEVRARVLQSAIRRGDSRVLAQLTVEATLELEPNAVSYLLGDPHIPALLRLFEDAPPRPEEALKLAATALRTGQEAVFDALGAYLPILTEEDHRLFLSAAFKSRDVEWVRRLMAAFDLTWRSPSLGPAWLTEALIAAASPALFLQADASASLVPWLAQHHGTWSPATAASFVQQAESDPRTSHRFLTLLLRLVPRAGQHFRFSDSELYQLAVISGQDFLTPLVEGGLRLGSQADSLLRELLFTAPHSPVLYRLCRLHALRPTPQLIVDCFASRIFSRAEFALRAPLDFPAEPLEAKALHETIARKALIRFKGLDEGPEERAERLAYLGQWFRLAVSSERMKRPFLDRIEQCQGGSATDVVLSELAKRYQQEHGGGGGEGGGGGGGTVA